MTEINVHYAISADKPLEEQVELRHIVQEMIEVAGVGEVVGSGTDGSQMDITIEVQDREQATSRLGTLFESLSLPDVEID